jgi:hypothetical protein
MAEFVRLGEYWVNPATVVSLFPAGVGCKVFLIAGPPLTIADATAVEVARMLTTGGVPE